MKVNTASQSISINDVLYPQKASTEQSPDKIEGKIKLFYYSILLSSSSIGISSLAYPSSMASSGIILWILLLVLAITINYISSYVLVYCGRETKSKDFSELTGKIMGRFRIFVDALCVMLNLGIIVTCTMTFNDFMTAIFQHQYFDGVSNILVKSKKSLFWIIFPNLLLIPFLLRRSIKDMNLICVGCVLAIGILAFFITYVFINQTAYQSTSIDFGQLEYFNISESPGSLSLLMFGFMNQQSILDVFHDLKRKKIQKVNQILNYQNIVSSFLYLVIALFGYLTFYNDSDIKTKNLFAFDLEKNLFYMIVNFVVGLSVFLSIVPTFKPTKDMILEYVSKQKAEASQSANFAVTIVLQAFLILSACLFEIFDLNFLDIVDFVSIFVSPMICIYLPLIFYVKISKNYRFLLLILLVFIANIFAIISF